MALDGWPEFVIRVPVGRRLRARRAFEAVMSMKKLDVAAIQATFDGG